MEFTTCEVYANEATAVHDDSGNKGANGTKSSNQSGERAAGGPRAARVLQPGYLPSLPAKALAFESFCLVPDRGVFGGRVNLLRKHNGPVLSMVFTHELGKEGLMFTGSADRTIKIWDPWGGSEAQLHSRSDHYCVQTINAHSGSVTSLRLLSQQHHALVSCSLDHTIKTWYPAEGRGLLLYPWYLPAQSITFASSGTWPTSLVLREGASATLFVGDTSGCISLYASGPEASSSSSDDVVDEALESGGGTGGCQGTTTTLSHEIAYAAKFQFKLKRKHAHFHSLGVLHLQLVADNSLVVSLGFDQKAQVLDAVSGALSSTIPNASQTRFTCCSWDSRGQLLVLGDALGNITIWDVFQDKAMKKLALFASGTPLVAVSVSIGSHANGGFLFAGVANCMKQWRINRDVGYKECCGHTEAITSLAIVIDEDEDDDNPTYGDDDHEVLVPRHEGDEDEQHSSTTISSCRFFSASLDNTLRCWDSYDMKATFGFDERDAEVTCMAPSRLFRKVFTGHENGAVKIWGIHTGQFVKSHVQSKSAITCVTSGVMREQEFLFAGDMDGMVTIWEVLFDGLTHIVTLSASISKDKRDEITSILFNRGLYLGPQGQEFFVVGYSTGHISIWSVGKKLMLRSFKAHNDSVGTLVMHGWFLFSGSEDMLIRMWNLVTLSETYELGVLRPPYATSSTGTSSPIVSLDVVPMLGLVVSAAADGTVLVWEYGAFEGDADFDAYGKIVYRNKHESHIQCMRYWQPRRSIICGTSDGKILIFALPSRLKTQTQLRETKRKTRQDKKKRMTKVKFAVLGDSFVDVVAGTLAPEQLPKWGGDVECSLPIQLQPGGSALNTATHIGKLATGNPSHELLVELHTVVGTDAFAPVLKTHLQSHGIALSSPMLNGVPTGVCIVLSGTQDRSFITHYGAAREFSIEHIDEAKVLSADHLHIGGFYSCANLQSNLKPLLEKAHAKGLTISLDTNYDSSEAWSGLEELLPLLDVFLPNEVEAMKISRTESVDAAMAYFAQHVPGITVIKIGEGGARAFCAKTNKTYVHGSFQTQVVDVTGAGDSFNAGFLSTWKATQGDIQEALKWGCATASKCVSALGACSLQSTYEDVHAVIRQGDLNA